MTTPTFMTRLARSMGLSAPASTLSEEAAIARTPLLPAVCGGAVLGAALTGLLLHQASSAQASSPPALAISTYQAESLPEVHSTAAPLHECAPETPFIPSSGQAILDKTLLEADEDESAGALPLAEAIQADPALLKAALDRFDSLTDPHQLSLLAVALSNVADPEVEKVALKACTSSSNRDQRAAAFEILDGMDLPSALPAVLEALEKERDPEVRRAALFALPPVTGHSETDAARVVELLSEILRCDRDPEARRRAALGLGEWSRAAGATAALSLALRADRSVDVRAGCAFALERARPSDLASRGALLAALEDPREDPLVRENAWHALGASAPLDAREQSAWRAFGDERAATVDGEEAFVPADEQGE